MNKPSSFLVFLLFLVGSYSVYAADNSARPFHKDYGFTKSIEQFKQIIAASLSAEKDDLDASRLKHGITGETSFAAAVCPHDDYAYAGPVYMHVMPRVKSKVVIIFGVAHKAKKYGLKDKLIFSDFAEWETVSGALKVSKLRETVLSELTADSFVIHPEFMLQEHSIEALMHWLKYYNPGAEILPVCVPYMKWERMAQLSARLGEIIGKVMKERGWKFNRDISILISNDSSHYGDQGWGGKNYAPFGATVEGYVRAVDRDISIAKRHLTGMVTPRKLKTLLHRLIDKDDPEKYRITWCGRFSVPFGMMTYLSASGVAGDMPAIGRLLSYKTSVGLGILEPVTPPSKVTAPANLHHWVGYTALGYW
jgi:AmmeMemoRadiSam system protein B